MVFAPIFGVNNHGQTIVFYCSFLSDKTIDSFVWLFKQFKNVMPSAPSKMIIIDQDPAMTKAIFQALLPQTFHRYFSWHILNKFYEKINAIKHKDCFSDFQSYIWNSYSQEEFNSLWMDIIEHN